MSDADFRSCLCWNSVNGTWCEGNNFYEQDSCRRYAIEAASYGAPIILLAFAAFFFPCIWCISRWCCNCCGGSRPTQGWCCPDHDDTGMLRKRRYTNITIFLNKFIFAGCIAGLLYFAAGCYTNNSDAQTAEWKIISDVEQSSLHMLDTLNETVSNLILLKNPSPLNQRGFRNPGATIEAQQIADTFQQQSDSIKKALSDIKKYDSHWRININGNVIGTNNIVLLLALIFMLCNCRRIMTMIVWLLCLSIVTLCFLFVGNWVVTKMTLSICNSYNQTFVPVIVGVIENYGGCNSGPLLTIVNNSALSYVNLTTTPDSTFCAAVNFFCDPVTGTFDCPVNPCAPANPVTNPWALFTVPTAAAPWIVPNVSTVRILMATAKAKAGTTCGSNYSSTDLCTLEQCSYSCSLDQLAGAPRTVAKNLRQFVDLYQPLLESLTGTSLADTYNCSFVRSQLNSTYTDVCEWSHHMSGFMIALVGVIGMTMAVIIMSIRGIKRWLRFGRKQSVVTVVKDVAYMVDAACNGVDVRYEPRDSYLEKKAPTAAGERAAASGTADGSVQGLLVSDAAHTDDEDPEEGVACRVKVTDASFQKRVPGAATATSVHPLLASDAEAAAAVTREDDQQSMRAYGSAA